MNDTIIVALIGMCGSLLGSIIGIIAASKLTNYRIEQLEKKVAEHNNLISRTYHLEEQAALTEEKIKVVNHRIEDLEKK